MTSLNDDQSIITLSDNYTHFVTKHSKKIYKKLIDHVFFFLSTLSTVDSTNIYLYQT